MSDEERQRQMDFILQQQAQLTTTVGRLSETVDRAYAAVTRNALAHAERPKLLRVAPKRKPAAPSEVSDAARAQYECEFMEREGVRLDSGMTPDCGGKHIMPDCCAYHATLLELGALEVWAYVIGHNRAVAETQFEVAELDRYLRDLEAYVRKL
jgi:hypothetical protein